MGLAWQDDEGKITFATWAPDGREREVSIFRFVRGQIQTQLLHAIAYESPFFSPITASAARPLMNDEGAIKAACQDLRIPFFAFTPPAVKNFVGVPGNARKERVMQRIRDLGYPVEDSHQADAVACLLGLKKTLSRTNVITKQRKLKL